MNVHLYSPGLEAMVWRDGYGKFFPKGTRISFSMHYNAIGTETTDQSKVGFRFARDAGAHAGEYDHRAEQRHCRAADGAEARGHRRVSVSERGAHPRPAPAHAPARAAGHRVRDSPRRRPRRAAPHSALGRLVAELLRAVAGPSACRRARSSSTSPATTTRRRIRSIRIRRGPCRGDSRYGTRCTRST